MQKYIPAEIEPKWQKVWDQTKIYETDLSDSANKYYTLVELPYCSGDLHMGHWFTFSYGDILSRFKRLTGKNVVFPIGFDAFGMPAENAAIKRGIHPQDWTYSNIENMTAQFKKMGNMFDWRYSTIASDPGYYKWNQWIFIKMLEKGIAYKGKMLSSWCEFDQTVLAEENIEAGRCWRCGNEVVKKEIDQWFFKITDYADKLIWSEPPQADWPRSLRDAQNSWIGKSEGVLIKFGGIEVFTTRPDTLFGATFIVLSPEHPLVGELTTKECKKEVEEYLRQVGKKTEQERKENREKTGVFTGSTVENPLTGKQVPVWVADYVLMGYGTGAIMAVPAHDSRDMEFAKKFSLEVKQVIKSKDLPYEGEGELVNSNEFNGLDSTVARSKISEYIEKHNLGLKKVQYHLRDWSISRQRYWGTPIPVIYCNKCGVVPVPVEDLPVELPYKVNYSPKGKAPLATAKEWVKVNCPKCKGDARRETETMDGFVDNSWYFFRYLDPDNDYEIFDKKTIQDWLPVEIYIGGAEHTYGHALYSRFFTKFFKDIGLIGFDEYAKKRVHHGVILGPDGHRMSKSRGNVVNPDEQVKQYGADSIRLYLSFLGPIDIVTSWNPGGINGIYHFLQRVWGLFDKIKETEPSGADLKFMYRKIQKVTSDLHEIKNNTAIAALMEWLNYLSRKQSISKLEYKNFLILLSPFAPHITEELWQMLGEEYSIHKASWPEVDPKYLEEDEVTIVVQVNGKMRETILIQKDILGDTKLVEELAKRSEKIQKFIKDSEIKKIIYVPGKVLNIVI